MQEMTEGTYRTVKAVLLAVVVAGFLWFVWTCSQYAENGRFVQYDFSTESSGSMQNARSNPRPKVIDTRSGQIKEAAE